MHIPGSILLTATFIGILASCKANGAPAPALPPAGNADTATLAYVFKAGTEGYSCFRIPAIVKTTKGTLLAFAEARKHNCKDEGDIDLVVKRSANNGATWGPIIKVWDDGDNTCGNPVPVVDESNGRVVLLMTWNKGEDHIREINSGASKDTRRVFVSSSDDDGISWAAAKEITAAVKPARWAWYGTGPCHGLQVKKGAYAGRLVIPCDYISLKTSDAPSRDSAHIIYSDDHGATWQPGGVVQKDRAAESTVAELSDGQLMLNIRNSSGGARLVATSKDGGASWQNARADSSLPDPICQGSLLNATINNVHTLFFSNPSGATRANMTVKMSTDDGNTWTKFYKVYSGPSAYSDIVLLSGAQIAIFYEGGVTKPYEGIAFKVIPVTDFK